MGSAQPPSLVGDWYPAPGDERAAIAAPNAFDGLTRVDDPGRTGGSYWYRGTLVVDAPGRFVLDFRHSSTIGWFRHIVLNEADEVVATASGGIESSEENPFALRHGREVQLAAGRYRLLTELRSPFLLASPEPALWPLAQYRESIKRGNALTLVGLGVLVGLGFYYAALALARRRATECLYALFILGNVLYNGAALLVFPDLFGVRWFYLVSVPILFSNIAYVMFVMRLLEIRRAEHPLLARAGLALIGLFSSFVLLALARPNWSLELDRYGVFLFTTYGLVAAVVRARANNSSARWYLLAITCFFVLAGLAISLTRVASRALTVEHLGLLAVVVEAALLALVLAHQFRWLIEERDSAEHRAREGYRIAFRDALTGLPNRYRLESDLAKLPDDGSLTFIDLDGLKHYNDRYGHQRGDELLCGFAEQLSRQLGERASLYRLSGDEFAVTSASGDLDYVEGRIDDAISALRESRFKFAGASFGSVRVCEDPSRNNLKHIADTRMYEQKRQRHASAPAEWLRVPPPAVEEDYDPSSIRRASGGSDDVGR